MNKHVFAIAFLLGALVIGWVGFGYLGTSGLALTMTALIAAVYALGGLELLRFRRATLGLSAALAAIPPSLADLGDWLRQLPPTLQNPVRLRIDGERVGLPGPALTPYLVGLLVMLGMLGTFLGMVVTLNGAVFALEGTTDLQAIRTALAAPIKGLGLAFGTSVAGVAASAMLGLISAFCRRERAAVAQQLDSRIATDLHRFTHAHQRQETFTALQVQARVLPQVVDTLQAVMARMEHMSEQMHQQLLSNQQQFHSEVTVAYTQLAQSVDSSLRTTLMQSAQAAGESIKPVVEAAMTGIASDATRMHERVIDTVQTQLDGLAARFGASTAAVADGWTAALAGQERSNSALVAGLDRSLTAFAEKFDHGASALLGNMTSGYATLQAEQAAADRQRLDAWTASLGAIAATLNQEWQQATAHTLSQQQQICATLARTAEDITTQTQSTASTTLGEIARLVSSSEALVQTRVAAEAEWLGQHGERMDQLAGLMQRELSALREEEAARGQAAVTRLGELQSALASHLTTLGTALEAPITRLIDIASEAPRAAAEVIAQLRQEISHGIARDNALLEERSRIMATLNSLLEAINHASAEQRAVIDSLVASSAVALDKAGIDFAAQVGAETGKLAEIAAHVTSSAVDVASLSEAFGFAVNAFAEANQKLIDNLDRIEGTMEKSMARSDEQLAYYVAQAREIIDLSLMSQKEVVEEMRQLPLAQARAAGEAR